MSDRTPCGMRSSPPRWTQVSRCGTSRKPPPMLTREPRCATTGPAPHLTGTPPTSSPPTSPERPDRPPANWYTSAWPDPRQADRHPNTHHDVRSCARAADLDASPRSLAGGVNQHRFGQSARQS
jgi:hypothetical protein